MPVINNNKRSFTTSNMDMDNHMNNNNNNKISTTNVSNNKQKRLMSSSSNNITPYGDIVVTETETFVSSNVVGAAVTGPTATGTNSTFSSSSPHAHAHAHAHPHYINIPHNHHNIPPPPPPPPHFHNHHVQQRGSASVPLPQPRNVKRRGGSDNNNNKNKNNSNQIMKKNSLADLSDICSQLRGNNEFPPPSILPAGNLNNNNNNNVSNYNSKSSSKSSSKINSNNSSKIHSINHYSNNNNYNIHNNNPATTSSHLNRNWSSTSILSGSASDQSSIGIDGVMGNNNSIEQSDLNNVAYSKASSISTSALPSTAKAIGATKKKSNNNNTNTTTTTTTGMGMISSLTQVVEIPNRNRENDMMVYMSNFEVINKGFASRCDLPSKEPGYAYFYQASSASHMKFTLCYNNNMMNRNTTLPKITENEIPFSLQLIYAQETSGVPMQEWLTVKYTTERSKKMILYPHDQDGGGNKFNVHFRINRISGKETFIVKINFPEYLTIKYPHLESLYSPFIKVLSKKMNPKTMPKYKLGMIKHHLNKILDDETQQLSTHNRERLFEIMRVAGETSADVAAESYKAVREWEFEQGLLTKNKE